MTTISVSSTIGIKLNPTSYTSPVVIEAGVTISNPGYPYGVYTPPDSANFFAIQNDGTIIGAGTSSGIGVYLAPGGSVTNAASASITGIRGVEISGAAGSVVNDGSIGSTGTHILGVYLPIAGVYLHAGGSVTNAASASITGLTGIYIGNSIFDASSSTGAGTVFNDGSIASTTPGLGAGSNGVVLSDGGSVTNAAAGSITGYVGVNMSDAEGAGAGTLVNDGSIAGIGGSSMGVELQAGGSVTNAASASITGDRGGVVIEGGAATVVNDGSIASTSHAGVSLNVGPVESVTNAASASITGVVGVSLYGGGTLTNAGTIIGNSGTAVAFDSTGFVGSFSNRLILDPGYGFSGLVVGGTSASNTLELASAASAGTVTGLGTEFLHFGSVVFDAGADWSIAGGVQRLAGTLTAMGSVQEQATSFVNRGSIIVNAGVLDVNNGTFDNEGTVTVENRGTFFIANAATLSGAGQVTMETGSTVEIATPVPTGQGFLFSDPATFILDDPSTFDGTVGGLAAGDVIKLAGEVITSGSITGTTLALKLAGGGTQNLNVAPGESGATFTTTASGGLVVACFAAGTRLLTISGEVPVEELRIGDQVVTVRGCRLAPIVWLGHRQVNCVGHPRPEEVWPVRVKAGAIAAGVPHRDLWLSAEHAVLLRAGAETVLVPIRHLVNGTTIVQVPCASITYWHVEFASHDAIVAEGLPAETYLDTGNRADFANGGAAVTVHPNFADAVWRARACAPQLRHGDALVALQRRLAMRAAGCDGARQVRSQTG